MHHPAGAGPHEGEPFAGGLHGAAAARFLAITRSLGIAIGSLNVLLRRDGTVPPRRHSRRIPSGGHTHTH